MADFFFFAILQRLTTGYISLLKWLHIIPTAQYFTTSFHLIDLYHSHLPTRVIINILRVNMLFKAGHMMCFFLFEEDTSSSSSFFSDEKVNLIHFNYTALERLPCYLNLFAAIDFLLVLSFFRAIFLDNTGFSCLILKQVLLEGKSQFFFFSTWTINKTMNNFLVRFFKYNFNEAPVERNLQNIGLLVKSAGNVVLSVLSKCS